MNPAAVYLLKVVLCSAVLYAYYLLALRNRLFHQWNRFFLLATVLFSLLFPLIPLPSFYPDPGNSGNITLYQLLYTSSDATVVRVKKTGQWNWSQVAMAGYASIALLLTLQLVTGLLKIKRLLHQSAVQQLGKISFVCTDHPAAPFSFFNWLFWKKSLELESEGGQSVFRHELVHIREKHSVDKLLLQTVLVLFWINPFFWLVRRELQMIHEFIADKKAVGDAGTGVLAAMILQSVYGKNYPQFINPFFHQPIKRRLTMLQKTLNNPRNTYLGRVLSLPLFAVLLLACAKKEASPFNSNNTNFSVSDTLPKKQTLEETITYNTKDSANTMIIQFKDGKKDTLSRKEAMKRGFIDHSPPAPANPKALVVIDDEIKGTREQVGNLDQLVPAENIERVNVWKGPEATQKYGPRAAAGVIEITTRKAAGTLPVFEKTEQPPTFPGGEPAWRQFLQKNLNASVPVDKGAPAGAYTTVTEFKVAADGTLSDFRSLTSHGYGMEQEVLALMQKSPKWEPAAQNGKKVTALHRQPITFVVAEADVDMTIKAKEIRIEGDGGKALLVVDGVEKGTMKDFPGNNFPVQPKNIESMNVLKGKSATTKYGDRGKDGVIEIITKKQ